MERIKQILTDFISTNPFNLLNQCSKDRTDEIDINGF